MIAGSESAANNSDERACFYEEAKARNEAKVKARNEAEAEAREEAKACEAAKAKALGESPLMPCVSSDMR
jgi:hypothetical protein